MFFQAKCADIFLFLYENIYDVATQKECLDEALLTSTHNICFHGEIRIIFSYNSSTQFKLFFYVNLTTPDKVLVPA